MSLSKRKLEWQQKSRKNNPEKHQAYAKKSLIQRRIHWKTVSEEQKVKRRPYFESRRKLTAERTRLWKINNREHCNTINANRRARQKNAIGSYTVGEWELLKKQYGYKCPSCNKIEPSIKLTRDHIIPLVKGGSNYIENIQPLCRSCNSSKNDSIIKF